MALPTIPKGSSILSNLTNSPPSFAASARSDSSAYANTRTNIGFSTGGFSLGGGGTINILFIVAGVIALAFVMREFFKKK
jgi:hypothetical protein